MSYYIIIYFYLAEILEKIKEAGFSVGLTKEVKLSKEQAAEFYGEHIGQPYFDQLAEEMSRLLFSLLILCDCT